MYKFPSPRPSHRSPFIGFGPSHRVLPAALRLVLLLVLVVPMALTAGPARADGGIDLGVALGIQVQDGDVDLDLNAVSLRAHRWLGERWGIEGSLSATEEGPLDDYLYLDLSAVYRIRRNERFSTLLFGGVGALDYPVHQYRTPFGFLDRGDDTVATAHVGIAFHIFMGEHLYFRPDLRHRRHFDVQGDADDSSFDATLGFGWRF